MTTDQLQCFFKAAEMKSFTKAAETLFLSQPALSKRINALEKELGMKLFQRDKSSVTELTAAGRIIYDGFLRLEEERQTIIAEAKNLLSGNTGDICLGIYESQLIDDRLRELLDGFSASYPSMNLIVTTASLNGLHDELIEGQMDAVITLGYDALRRKDVASLKLYSLPVLLVVPNQLLDRLSATESLRDFSGLPFLTISRDQNLFQDEVLRQSTEKAGFEPEWVIAKDEKNFVMLLEMGKGVAPLHSYHKCCNSPHNTCFALPDLLPCDFYLMWNPKRIRPQLAKLISYCRQAIV